MAEDSGTPKEKNPIREGKGKFWEDQGWAWLAGGAADRLNRKAELKEREKWVLTVCSWGLSVEASFILFAVVIIRLLHLDRFKKRFESLWLPLVTGLRFTDRDRHGEWAIRSPSGCGGHR